MKREVSKVEKALIALRAMHSGSGKAPIGTPALLIVTLVYLGLMLSVAPEALARLLWFALYPIVMAPVVGEQYGRVFVRSLAVLPFVFLIGIFNPLYQTEVAFRIGSVTISRGWVTFMSILVRALLSVQALLLLVDSVGFAGLCSGLRRIGVPALLTTQLMMVYRYMTVLLQESLDMTRARQARGYRGRNMSLSMWGTYCGQLFLRTVARSERIHRAMLARGFNGSMPVLAAGEVWNRRDTVTLVAVTCVFALFRWGPLPALFAFG